MKTKIICIGKLKEDYLKAGIAEYNKRLGRKIELVELPDDKIPEHASDKEVEAVKNSEGQKILEQLTKDDKVIALAPKGKLLTSEELSARVNDYQTYGATSLVYLIGGSLGLSAEVLARSDLQLSFGRLTMPHQLMRLVLMEQIYRIEMINRGSVYHK